MSLSAKITDRWRLAREIARGNRSPLELTVAVLYRLALLAERWGPPRHTGNCRRVVHVSPNYFAEDSVVGGGERYAVELASAMALRAEVTLVAFGPRRRSFRHGERLRVEIYPVREYLAGNRSNPVSFGFLASLLRADVIHCHQHEVFLTNLCTLAGALLRRRVFVTDLGASSLHFGERYPLDDLVSGFLAISEFAAGRHVARLSEGRRQKAEGSSDGRRQTAGGSEALSPRSSVGASGASSLPSAVCRLPPAPRVHIVGGGVDVEALRPEPGVDRTHALYVGRLLPGKGINYLIEGLPPGVPLRVVGRPYHEEYFALLRTLAHGKPVEFLTGATDDALRACYQSAIVSVLPTVYRDIYGHEYDRPELLGLVLLEAMACGTPVICTRVGAMPEIVEDGVNGFVVPPNDPVALGDAIRRIAEDPERARRMGEEGRRRVSERWNWDQVAERCLEAYHTR
jgi:glycosyltransferase involved in cell wall biosynthesis